MDALGKSNPGKRNGRCKGPEIGAGLALEGKPEQSTHREHHRG